MTHLSFNLVDRPWIPCTTQDGLTVDLSLKELFERAHKLGGVADQSPLVTLALHRHLLALVHAAVRGPTNHADWRALWEAGQLGSVVLPYLDRWHHRFDLFDPDRPFFQVGRLEIVDHAGKPQEPSPVARLFVEEAAGNNATLFSHTLDADPDWVPAGRLARQVLAVQCMALGGGQGPTTNLFGPHPYASHAPAVGAISVLLQRHSVFETLLLNLLIYGGESPMPRRGADAPVWEQDEYRPPGPCGVTGYLDYLTLPARYLRLVAESQSGETGARTVVFAPGLSLDVSDTATVNPQAFYHLDSANQRRPVALREGRALWRDSSALLSLSDDGAFRPMAIQQASSRRYAKLLGPNTLLSLVCYGLANDRAKALSWVKEELPASVRVLEEAELVRFVREAVDAAEVAGEAMSRALRRCAVLCLEAQGKKADKTDVKRIADRMARRSAYWVRLSIPFTDFMRCLPGDPVQALLAWQKSVLDAARHGFARGTEALQAPMARRYAAFTKAETILQKGLHALQEQLRDPQNAGPPEADRSP